MWARSTGDIVIRPGDRGDAKGLAQADTVA
jgi:hypothetical protein